MIALYLGALILSREPDPFNILGASALLILFVSPAELFNVGFQLSFVAVLALSTLYPALEESWENWRSSRAPLIPDDGPATVRARFRNWCRQAVFVSIAATSCG